MIVSGLSREESYTTAKCLATDSVGDLVYITASYSGNDYQVAKAQPINGKIPVIAVIVHKSSATKAIIQLDGNVKNVYTGLAPGKTYFLGVNGTPVITPPIPSVGERLYSQPIGVAVSHNILNFRSNCNITILVG